MRIRYLLIGLSSLLLPACIKPAEEPSQVSVSFRLSREETKVTGASYMQESAVIRWSVFVFDVRTGGFRYGSSADAAPVVFSLQAGRVYRCLALANYPLTGPGALDPASVSSAEDLTEKVAGLDDNEPGKLLMYGESMLMPVPGEGEKTILVRRLVSRLEVRDISVDFSSCPEWTGKTLLLRHLYITNAYKTTRYGEDVTSVSPARSSWYNSLGWHGGGDVSASMDALLGDRDLNVAIDESHPYSAVHSFYFYPNPVEEDSYRTDSWTPRHTRLVLEASVDGETYYYPIDIPPAGRNSVFSATGIVIHGPGWEHPEGGTISGSMIDVAWDVAESIILD
ncbi:MAG: hypothetical protein IK008_06070 [Bacteroidales bacterium]|nr:hypothetical protein [Bacteroidales bacterium]